ncbi:MAG: hypothetical protein IPM53_03430 [Anaerolineaceae bacterium]|nr:hypothetical protein [Anaerolineaceae bacterium]
MSNSGKLLESFVEQIEKILLPQGITVSPNEKIYNDDGVQIAEFDIEIEGKIGTTHFKWLIECRDRPSEGPAPGSWIEQLVGRRERFNFNKVIAVSTTGFAEGAKQYANHAGIETRVVTDSDVSQIRDWFLLENLIVFRRGVVLVHATLLMDEKEPKDRQDALKNSLGAVAAEEKILQSSESGESINVATAFLRAANNASELYDELIPQGGSKKINLAVNYPQDNSHYVVETELGKIRIIKILFQGEITVTVERIPVHSIKKYENLANGEEIATKVSFDFEIDGSRRELSFHRIADTGEIQVSVSVSVQNA